jgi:ribonucleoside-diphosphate reductase alpha chain
MFVGTTMQSPNTESTFQPPSWRELERHFDNSLAVFLLMLMTPSIVSLLVIWLLADTLHKGRASVSTQVASGASTAKIRGGEVQHTGVVPFLKKFEATVRCCTQNGIRGGSATVHFPIWHKEIEDIIVLKNNKGTEDNRVRKLDYSIQFSRLFYERFINDEEMSLFSPHDVPSVSDAFGFPEFDDLYVAAERNESIPRKTVRAQELVLSILKERAETGRIYIMNIDHCNSHSSFLDKVWMSNLCQEITLPTEPLQHIDDV